RMLLRDGGDAEYPAVLQEHEVVSGRPIVVDAVVGGEERLAADERAGAPGAGLGTRVAVDERARCRITDRPRTVDDPALAVLLGRRRPAFSPARAARLDGRRRRLVPRVFDVVDLLLRALGGRLERFLARLARELLGILHRVLCPHGRDAQPGE